MYTVSVISPLTVLGCGGLVGLYNMVPAPEEHVPHWWQAVCLLVEPWLAAGQVQVRGPEPRCRESESTETTWSSVVQGCCQGGQDVIKHECSRKHNNLPRTGKGERMSWSGEGAALFRIVVGEVRGATRLDTGLHLGKQACFLCEMNGTIKFLLSFERWHFKH